MAIIRSSSVGITQAETELRSVVMHGPLRSLARVSSSMPSQAAAAQTRARIGGAFSPIPAVKTP